MPGNVHGHASPVIASLRSQLDLVKDEHTAALFFGSISLIATRSSGRNVKPEPAGVVRFLVPGRGNEEICYGS